MALKVVKHDFTEEEMATVSLFIVVSDTLLTAARKSCCCLKNSVLIVQAGHLAQGKTNRINGPLPLFQKEDYSTILPF